MKIAIVLVILGLVGLSHQAIDYTNQVNAFASCNAATGTKSPIQLSFMQCGPYDSFELTLPDKTATISGDPTKQPYTGGSLNVNGRQFTSQNIVVHRQAEHVLYDDAQRADLEVQIEMTDANNKMGILSFLFYTTNKAGAEGTERTRAKNNLNVINGLSATNWDLKLSKIPTAIQNKLSNDVYLNVYTYEGTTTDASCTPATWYIYASPLYVDQAQIDSFVTALNTPNAFVTPSAGSNAKSYATTVGGGNVQQGVTKLCFSGYFQVRMDVNYGLWFAIGILLLYFIFTLSMDVKPITDYDYKENGWTHHPIYSIYKVGNDIFTRKSRASLLLVSIINMCMWNSVWYRIAYNNGTASNPVNIITFALASIPIGWFFYYWFGFMLRKYYLEKLKFIESNNESHDNRAQFYIFIFYFMVFVAIWVGFGITVWNMNELKSYIDATPSNYWVASLFVAMGLEWFVFDMITAGLAASSKGLRDFFRWKGFVYDDLCHKTYVLLLKKD
jgi:carbonic anhydrase